MGPKPQTSHFQDGGPRQRTEGWSWRVYVWRLCHWIWTRRATTRCNTTAAATFPRKWNSNCCLGNRKVDAFCQLEIMFVTVSGFHISSSSSYCLLIVVNSPGFFFQPLEAKPLPLGSSETYDYMLSLKQEFRGCMRASPYFLKPKSVKKGEAWWNFLLL